jgi:hypothetical protein
MLQIRYHQNFKGNDTLLFAGSAADLKRLHTFFQEWSGEEVDLIERLQAKEKLYLHSVKAIHLKTTTKYCGLNWNVDTGTWIISVPYLETMIGELEGLLETSVPGHQYFDYPGLTGNIQIMVAKDEYPLPER